MSDTEYNGHLTLDDGSHIALSKEVAKALWESAQAAGEKRAEAMPDSRAALSVLFDAHQRLRDLGWREGIYCPKDGSTFAVAMLGSTGMWTGWYSGDWPKGFLMAAGEANSPHGSFWKPLADLTEAETLRLHECDEAERRHNDRIARSMGAIFDDEAE
jgi:hypothetical protein